MEKLVTLPARDLRAAFKAVLPAASKDRSRPHLSGVFVKITARQCDVVATDTYRLHKVTVTWPEGAEDAREGRILVPRDAAEGVLKALGTAKACEGIAVELRPGALHLSDGRVLPFAAGKASEFPPYARVIPQDPKGDGGPVRVNPSYLADAADAAAAIGAEGADIQPAGGALDPVLFSAKAEGPGGCGLDLVGVVMPMRR